MSTTREPVPALGTPEQRFLEYARTGDQTIIQGLIVEFSDRAYTHARRITGPTGGADDAVQDACIRLVASAGKYDGSVPFGAWLGRLVSLAALNHRERRTLRHTNFTDMSAHGTTAMNKQLSDEEKDESPEVEVLRGALAELPDGLRTPLTMHYFGGLNYNETGAALGIPVKTLEKRISRGLERLREKFGRAGFALTSAGLLTMLASLPTYAAQPALKASLASIATKGVVSAGRAALIFSKGAMVKMIAAALVVMCGAIALTANHQRGTSATHPLDLSRGLVGHWTLDESVGTIAADSSGNGFNGTLADYWTPGWIEGKIGGALDFDGEATVVSVGSPAALTNLARFTIAAWVMPRGFGREIGEANNKMNRGRIVDKRNSESGAGWSLYLANRATGLTSGTFCFRQDFSIAQAGWETQENSVALGIWQHVAIAYDNGSADNRPIFYLNGIHVATTIMVAPAGSKSSDAASTLTIGNAATLDRAFDGAIDDVRIYDRILSASEVQVLATGNNASRK
jgi:RNA polymerase sigma factor (sigma-70 family)